MPLSLPPDPLLDAYLMRIGRALEPVDPDATMRRVAGTPAVRELRLEPWEISAYRKLCASISPTGSRSDVLRLYVSAAALRLRIDEEARRLSAETPAAAAPELLEEVRKTLERARELDEAFGDILSEGRFRADGSENDQIFRSRFRLLRGFSGLWLIYDEQARRGVGNTPG